MSEQMSFADDLKKEIESLHICYENQKKEMTIEEIFDKDKYDELLAVTYSVSPLFLNNYLSEFSKVDIIVGINEDRVQRGAYDMAKNIKAQIESNLLSESTKLYDKLNTSFKKKLSSKTFDIKIPLGYTIHSKFYLLNNSTTNDNRIIIGSSNLSDRAFNANNNQFENILIYDNNSLFDIYNEYYNDLLAFVKNYFPKKLLDINTKKINDNSDFDSVIILNNEDIDLIKEASVEETIENVRKNIEDNIIKADIVEDIKNIDIDRSAIIRQRENEEKIEEVSYKIIKETINTRTKVPTLKTKSSIKKMVKRNVETLKVKKVSDTDNRDELYSKIEIRNTTNGKSGLLVKSKLNDEYLNFGEFQDKETIRKSLVLIDRFIKTFEDYLPKYNDRYGQRIMEAIFYTYTSPFLYEIKRLARTSEERHDIPQFLFIGGVGGSGKSSLIKMLSKMLGISNLSYHNFSELGEGHRAKSDRVKTLESWVMEENVYPIIVDEVALEFFSNPSYGRELILNTTNNKVDVVDPFPVIIATTNADSYSLPTEARRRSYYLKINKVFKNESRKESPLVYKEIYETMNNTLFLDFVMRMSQRLENKEDYEWNKFTEGSSKVDFLYQSREIFKEYYKMCEMPLPRYFPTNRYQDDYETNQEKWKKLYKRAGNDEFIFDEISGNMYLNTIILDENGQRYGIKESEIYKQALDQIVVVGTLSGIDIELDTREFFKWLDIENPYKDYYKNLIKNYYLSHEKQVKKDNNFIYLPLSEISKGKEQSETIISWINPDIDFENEENVLIFDKNKFYKWIKISEKKNFLDRLFS